MRELIMNNIEFIGTIAGAVIVILIVLYSKELVETKWGEPIILTIIILGLIKFCELMGKILVFLSK